jgi:hypothetical protein
MSGAGKPRDISVIGHQTVSADSPIKSQDEAGTAVVSGYQTDSWAAFAKLPIL